MRLRLFQAVAMLLMWAVSLFACALELSRDEQAWLQTRDVLRVGTYEEGLAPFEFLRDGQLVGVGPDFLQQVTKRLNVNTQVTVFNDRQAVIDALRRGDIDVMMNMAPTFLGTGFLRYSLPYVDNDLVILCTRKSNRIIDPSDLKNVRIAVLADSAESISLRELYPSADIQPVSSIREAAVELESDKVDAFVGNRYSIRYFAASHNSRTLRIVGEAGLPLPELGFAFPKDHVLLARVFDKVLSEVGVAQKQAVLQRWVSGVPVLPRQYEGIGLSPDQLNMLAQLPALRVSNLEGYPPFSFRTDDGEPRGVVEDYIGLIARQLQLKMTRVRAHDLEELASLVKSGQIDMVPGLPETEERKGWMVFSKPYARFPLVIITRQDTVNVDSILTLGKARVAISERAEPIPTLLKENPEVTLVSAKTVAQGLEMLANHKVDAYVGNLVVSDRLITEKYTGILKVAAPTGRYAELSVAVAPKYAYLMPLINQALDNISLDRREQIRATWFPIKYDTGINWSLVLYRTMPALLVLATVLGILFVAYLRLRREIGLKVEAQRTLGNQLRFQSALLDTIPFPVLGKDRDDRYIAVNEAYEEQFGGRRSEMLGRTPEEIGYVDAIVALERQQDSRVAIAEGRTLHQTLHFKDGQRLDREGMVWLKPFFDQEGQVGGSVVVLVDVTEIRRSQAKVRASEALLTSVTESLPVTVFQCCLQVNGHMHFTYVAGAPGSTFGFSAESMMRDHDGFLSLLDAEDIPRVQAAFALMKATLNPFEVDFRMHVKNGVRWFRGSTGRGVREANGNVQWGGYFEDITDAREHKQVLERAKVDAESATKAKSEFLAMMSHEIRTPVHGILGWLEVFSGTKLSAQQQQMLTTIQSSTELLSQVVDDILDFSKLEAGQVSMDVVPVDLRVLLDKTLDIFTLQADKKGIGLCLYLDQGLVAEVMCDHYRVRQILLNLLSNALKFTESGHVSLRLEVLQNNAQEQLLSISVSDTGIGVSEDLQNRLFKPFRQAETSTTRRFGGTGLGLSISQGLAAQMGGNLSMQSVPDEGTTVSFKVPFQKHAAIETLREFNGVIAAIVCDDVMLADALQANLMTLGMTVVRVAGLSQVDSMKMRVDVWFVEQAQMPHAWGASYESGVPTISLVSTLDDAGGAEWRGSAALRCSHLSWVRLLNLCRTLLNGEGGIDLGQERGVSNPPLSIARREEALHEKKLILVAEDHPVSRDLIRQQIELLGYVCDAVVDGKEALEAIATTQYGMVIADYHMPYIDGLELSRRVRQAERDNGTTRLPIVALTASAMAGQAEECIVAGMDAYLRKPLNMGDLRMVLEQFLSAKATQVEDTATSSVAGEALCGEIDLDYVKEVYGSSQRVRTVMVAVMENMQEELSVLETLHDRNEQARLIHRMASGFGIIKALPLLRHASELEVGLQQGDADMREDLLRFKERIRLLLDFLRDLYC
ncbi:transporter substrate-binding domain-containing protein [Pseudomonas protegens]|jgi:PAS domain S-box-containing protein|uniref:transporter substrate-binding domain-containing protein n=1 Tax=Pseudomonas protegens TaxID=380021 RepID=UPI003EB95738